MIESKRARKRDRDTGGVWRSVGTYKLWTLLITLILWWWWCGYFCLQKARLARIRIAKASSGAAFVSKKKAAEARLAAQESGMDFDENYREEDIFELQHHHLLRCLEKTTVRNFNRVFIQPRRFHSLVFYLGRSIFAEYVFLP